MIRNMAPPKPTSSPTCAARRVVNTVWKLIDLNHR